MTSFLAMITLFYLVYFLDSRNRRGRKAEGFGKLPNISADKHVSETPQVYYHLYHLSTFPI